MPGDIPSRHSYEEGLADGYQRAYDDGHRRGQRDMLAACLRVLRRERDADRADCILADRLDEPAWRAHQMELAEAADTRAWDMLRELKP